MSLRAWSAELKLKLFDELRAGKAPSIGEYDAAIFREALVKQQPQIGATIFKPHAAIFEFIYPDPGGAATILRITVKPPERIVYLPVPEWVVEDIWQGGISGGYYFESEAEQLVQALRESLSEKRNSEWFEKQAPVRRE